MQLWQDRTVFDLSMEGHVGWVIGIGVVVLIIWAINASGNKEVEAKISAIAALMGTEDAFRRYWRYFNQQLGGEEMTPELEERLVNRFFARHQEIARLMGTVTAANQGVMQPALTKQSNDLDDEIVPFLSPAAGAKWRAMSEREQGKFLKRFAHEHLGLKL